MPRRDPSKEKYWRRLLRQWRRSGLSGRAFCAEHGVRESSFYAWRREIARRDRPRRTAILPGTAPPHVPAPAPALPPFLQLAVAAEAARPPAIEVVLAEGRRLRVRPGFDADLLRQLVRLLEEPSC